MNAPDRDYYDAFAEALLHGRSDDPQVLALLAQPAFAIYRNTVFKGCVDALLANYPAVHRLVGSAWMESAALAFARGHLPRQASLIAYGEGFADFLASLDAAQDLPYLPGVAALDRCWTESHLAADQPLLEVSALHVALAAGQDVTLVPHAATRWHLDAQHPVYTIWDANRSEAGDTGLAPHWQGEAALLTRAHDHVQWQLLGAGACRFLDACRDGCSIARAAGQALAIEPDLEIGAMLGQLIQADAFTSFY
ncbi:DNA-binding domain-containing protein [Herbaspirillum sp. alder98]|uniref:HvfC/BufC N-terminal domain-containing protein n=1 Tax=Herbaspirillum sp. alder98 TaxID=2913096 RepID=UPI001CD8AA1C|nr:DNA-binding domain-containing protein [Herbaspirillum sp. alder98]MCA1323557.1 DNA-binding domain-containing protein [Herbaspirillum sp. alder98]